MQAIEGLTVYTFIEFVSEKNEQRQQRQFLFVFMQGCLMEPLKR